MWLLHKLYGSNSAQSPPQTSSESGNSLSTQYSFFKEEADEGTLIKNNKVLFTKLMQSLEKKGLLVPETINDYVIVGKPIYGGQGIVYKVVQKKEYESHLNPDGTYFGGDYLALKKMDIFWMNKIEIRTNEIELISSGPSLESVIHAKKVFFEFDTQKATPTINIVMPWINHTLISWFSKTNMDETFLNTKRRFEEVRRVLTSILEAISWIHHLRYIHMDIKPKNILIHEFWNKESEEDEEDEEYGPVLIQKPILADFGTVKDLTNTTTRIGFTAEYAAPEVLQKEPFISTRADIYSFGMILYKIFVNESEGVAMHREKHSSFQINKVNIKERMGRLFPLDIKSITDTMIEDIAKIISMALEENVGDRPEASELLFEHIFFDFKPTFPPHVSEYEIENTFEYGLQLLEGKNGYPRDLKKAREIFQTMSDTFNHAGAKFLLDYMVANGIGGIKKTMENKYLFKSAEDAGDYFGSHQDSLGFSKFALGFYYSELDEWKPFDLLEQSSSKGNSFAQNLLGIRYETNSYYSIALTWQQKSADQGNCKAQYDLGEMYKKGTGVEMDYSKSSKLFQLSADQGYCDGQTALAESYYCGWGLPLDKPKALHFFELAAAQGDFHAANMAGGMLALGDGVPQDLDKAREIFERAEEMGSWTAMKKWNECLNEAKKQKSKWSFFK